MAKIIKGYYKSGVWHEYKGKLYDSVGYNTNGSITQKVISESLGGIMELISGYSMAIRVHGDASCSNLLPFYFVTDGESFSITLTYNKAAIALNIISIIMGETDITSTAYDDGVISIDSVTGNVTITVETSSVTDETPFYERITANGINVLNPTALLKGVKGNTLIWEQRWYWGGTLNYNEPNNISNVVKGSGTIASEITYSAHINDTIIISTGSQLKVGNIYYMGFYVRFPNNPELTTCRIGIGDASSKGFFRGNTYSRPVNNGVAFVKDIKTADYAISAIEFLNNSKYNWIPSGGVDIEIFDINVFNLTYIFGKGNEPTTTVAFDEMFPYKQYDYNTGKILNARPTDFVSRSRNIWDEDWETGQIDSSTGENKSGTTMGRSKNYIPILPNTRYYYSKQSGGTFDFYAAYYDINKNFILRRAEHSDFTTHEDAYYMRFQTHTNYGATYNNDICIAPYDEAKNGTYTPYFEDVINLDVTTLKPSTGSIEQIYPISVTTGRYINTNVSVGDTCTYATTSSSSSAYGKIAVKAGETCRIYGWTDGVTNWKQYFLTDINDVVTYVKTGAVDSRETPTVVTIEEDGYLCVNLIRYNSTTDKIEQVYDTLFPRGLKSGADAEGNIFRDEIYNDNGVWKGVLRVANTRTSNAVTLRYEYDVLPQEEVYVLDRQDIPNTFKAETGGAEYILPTNGTTPTTALVPIVAQYGAIPSRGLLGGGLTRGGGSDNGGYESEEPAEELDDIDEKLGEELNEELGENSNDETEEETKEDVDKPMPVVEKQELKK